MVTNDQRDVNVSREITPARSFEGTEYTQEYIEAPRVLNATRLFLPYSGCIEIGYTTQSDGNGNADVAPIIVIKYGNGWIALNMDQIPNFFIALREECNYENIEGRTYFDRIIPMNIQIRITKNENSFDVLFIDEMGDNMYINNLLIEDLIALLKLERCVDCCLHAKQISATDINNKITEIAMSLRETPSKILHLTENWYTDPVIVEIGINHLIFFEELIEEINRNSIE